MADVMTFEEHRGPIAGQVVAWVRRRQQRRLLLDRGRGAVRLHPAHRRPPELLRPPQRLLDWARAQGANIELGDDPEAAVAGARCVVTDSWVSMADDPN